MDAHIDEALTALQGSQESYGDIEAALAGLQRTRETYEHKQGQANCTEALFKLIMETLVVLWKSPTVMEKFFTSLDLDETEEDYRRTRVLGRGKDRIRSYIQLEHWLIAPSKLPGPQDALQLWDAFSVLLILSARGQEKANRSASMIKIVKLFNPEKQRMEDWTTLRCPIIRPAAVASGAPDVISSVSSRPTSSSDETEKVNPSRDARDGSVSAV